MKQKWMARALSLVMVAAFLPGIALADTWYLEDGDITIEATLDSENNTVQQVTQGNESRQDDAPIISSRGEVTNTVTIDTAQGATANVTIENVNINVSNDGKAAVSTTGGGNVTIELEGENTLKSGDYHAGLEKGNAGNLTIQDQDGDGALKAEGGLYGAGIGGGRYMAGNDITIVGGEIEAKGDGYGAGIGGGFWGDGTRITIENGTVIATGGTVSNFQSSAGIGGGAGGDGKDITISGGTVSATGGEDAAGIGGGIDRINQPNKGNGENIQISGGNVEATGGRFCAAIGGGIGMRSENITVKEDANVLAVGNSSTMDTTNLGDNGLVSITQNPEGNPSKLIYKSDGSVQEDTGATYVSSTNATCTAPGTVTYRLSTGEELTLTRGGAPALGHSFTKYTPDSSGETETALCDHGCGTKDTRSLGTAVASQQTGEDAALPAYWVTDEQGTPVSATQERTGNVLTITVNLDNATLRATVQSLRALQAQGIETVVFKTNQATSTFDVASLPDGTDCALTHTGKTLTFTLDGNDITNILK